MEETEGEIEARGEGHGGGGSLNWFRNSFTPGKV